MFLTLLESEGDNEMSKFPKRDEIETVLKKMEGKRASRPLPKDASPVDQIKYRLCEKFVIYKNTHKISQKGLALKIGIDESLISKILRYHFDEFTTDRLVKYLNELYDEVLLNVEVA